MSEKEKQPRIRFRKDSLNIEFDYQRTQTEIEEERWRDHYQEILSKRVGREIPRDEIGVSPKAGEPYVVTMWFQVKIGEPLYIGLWEVRQENPEALPKLVGFLNEYQDNRRLSIARSNLVEWASVHLNGIINPSDPLPEEVQSYLEFKGNVRGVNLLDDTNH